MVCFKGKKLLILAGASVHSKVVKAAQEMGIYTIVTDYLADSPAKRIADESWMIDIKDINTIIKRCKKEKVNGVLSFCIDPAQKPYQEICERLDLPCYGTREQFDILTNKRKFKDFCIKNEVDVIPEYSIDDIYNERVRYPVLIKPSDSRGSRGQSICYCKKDTLAAIESARHESIDGSILIEKYIEKLKDAAFSYIVIGGEPYLLKIGDRTLGKKEDRMNTQVLLTTLPSVYSNMYTSIVDLRIKKMIKELGVEFGPIFLQGFIDNNNKTVYFYDPGLRFPGGGYDLILREATGFNTMKTLVAYALTGDTNIAIGNPQNAYLLNEKFAVLITFAAKPGKIVQVQGLEKLKRHPNVIYARQILNEGTIVPNSGDIRQRVAAVGALFSNKDNVNNFIKDVFSTYQVYDESGKNMIISSLLDLQF